MYKTWTSSAQQIETLARNLEAHLNEFAHEVISVAYAASDSHYVLAVYRPLEASPDDSEEAAVMVAESLIEPMHK